MKIRCILIDDEPFALNILEDDLKGFPQVEILGKFKSPVDVPAFLENHEIDLIFTDIQMPEALGTQLVKVLKNPPMVIFTTAYHQYALEGFELSAVDYLMKPIRKERLGIALKKAEDQLKVREKLKEETEEHHIMISVEYQKVKLVFDEIVYIEGLKDYVKIYLVNRNHPLMTRSNLRGMEARLPARHFARIHNSYIINKQKITGFHQSKVTLSEVVLPVGKKYMENIREFTHV